MKISCTDAGKRFNRDWIFRHVNFEFTPGRWYAVTGPNGSGKSTFLQVLAGAVTLSEGKIDYTSGVAVAGEHVFRHTALAAPYLSVVEEMTLTEFLQFHQTFKPLIPGTNIPQIISILSLEKAAHKQIRYFSSGMKQRVKLAQAFFSHTPCLLLDEPCSNLDQAGIDLYYRLIHEYGKDRLLIICSNDQAEYTFCETVMNMLDFK